MENDLINIFSILIELSILPFTVSLNIVDDMWDIAICLIMISFLNVNYRIHDYDGLMPSWNLTNSLLHLNNLNLSFIVLPRQGRIIYIFFSMLWMTISKIIDIMGKSVEVIRIIYEAFFKYILQLEFYLHMKEMRKPFKLALSYWKLWQGRQYYFTLTDKAWLIS